MAESPLVKRFSPEFGELLRARREHLRKFGIRVSHAQGGGTYTVYKDPPEGVEHFKKEFILMRSAADDDKVTLGFECVDRPTPEFEPELLVEEPIRSAVRVNNYNDTILRLLAVPAPPNYG